MRRRIQPGWRYTLAQKVLTLLFGRPWHYISPWPMAGTAIVLLLVNGNKVLMGRRGGKVEGVGKWSGIGGFVELKDKESYAQALCRELEEETHLKLSPARFPASPHAVFLTYNQPKHEMASLDAAVGYYMMGADRDITRRLQTTEESTAYQWFGRAELERMIADGSIPSEFTDLHCALREIFRRLDAGETFPPLPV